MNRRLAPLAALFFIAACSDGLIEPSVSLTPEAMPAFSSHATTGTLVLGSALGLQAGDRDPSNQLVACSGAACPADPLPQPAYSGDPHPWYAVAPGTHWIASIPNGSFVNMGTNSTEAVFVNTFSLPAYAASASIDIRVSVDNNAIVEVNGVKIGATVPGNNFDSNNIRNFSGTFTPAGVNELRITNLADGGAIGVNYRATITYDDYTPPGPFALPVGSGNATTTTWNFIPPAVLAEDWPDKCTATPEEGLGSPWHNPRPASNTNPHPWGTAATGQWIFVHGSTQSVGPQGQSWSRYDIDVDGSGPAEIRYTGDNCTWIYQDGVLLGGGSPDEAVTWTQEITLSGTHRISFLLWDGGAAGGLNFDIRMLDTTPPVIKPHVDGTLGDNGWYTDDVTVSWDVTDPESDVSSTDGCGTETVSEDTEEVTFTCTATSEGGTASESVTIKRDATPPVITFSGNEGSYTVDQTVDITCEASDATSGLASEDCPGAAGDAYTFDLGTTTLEASALDNAGNGSSASAEFEVLVTTESLCQLVRRWVDQRGVAEALCRELTQGRNGPRSFINSVRAQTGRHVPAEYAPILIDLAQAL